jgi:hypothetical protein
MRTKGFGIIEILIGSAIIVTGILALIESYTIYFKYALANDRNVQAAFLAEEGLEATTYLRDMGWTANIVPLTPGTIYYLTWDSTNSYWKSTTTPQYVDGIFLRKITVDNVYRDISDKIVDSGTLDPNTKKVTVTLEYFQGHGITTSSMMTYIANFYDY